MDWNVDQFCSAIIKKESCLIIEQFTSLRGRLSDGTNFTESEKQCIVQCLIECLATTDCSSEIVESASDLLLLLGREFSLFELEGCLRKAMELENSRVFRTMKLLLIQVLESSERQKEFKELLYQSLVSELEVRKQFRYLIVIVSTLNDVLLEEDWKQIKEVCMRHAKDADAVDLIWFWMSKVHEKEYSDFLKELVRDAAEDINSMKVLTALVERGTEKFGDMVDGVMSAAGNWVQAGPDDRDGMCIGFTCWRKMIEQYHNEFEDSAKAYCEFMFRSIELIGEKSTDEVEICRSRRVRKSVFNFAHTLLSHCSQAFYEVFMLPECTKASLKMLEISIPPSVNAENDWTFEYSGLYIIKKMMDVYKDQLDNQVLWQWSAKLVTEVTLALTGKSSSVRPLMRLLAHMIKLFGSRALQAGYVAEVVNEICRNHVYVCADVLTCSVIFEVLDSFVSHACHMNLDGKLITILSEVIDRRICIRPSLLLLGKVFYYLPESLAHSGNIIRQVVILVNDKELPQPRRAPAILVLAIYLCQADKTDVVQRNDILECIVYSAGKDGDSCFPWYALCLLEAYGYGLELERFKDQLIGYCVANLRKKDVAECVLCFIEESLEKSLFSVENCMFVIDYLGDVMKKRIAHQKLLLRIVSQLITLPEVRSSCLRWVVKIIQGYISEDVWQMCIDIIASVPNEIEGVIESMRSFTLNANSLPPRIIERCSQLARISEALCRSLLSKAEERVNGANLCPFDVYLLGELSDHYDIDEHANLVNRLFELINSSDEIMGNEAARTLGHLSVRSKVVRDALFEHFYSIDQHKEAWLRALQEWLKGETEDESRQEVFSHLLGKLMNSRDNQGLRAECIGMIMKHDEAACRKVLSIAKMKDQQSRIAISGVKAFLKPPVAARCKLVIESDLFQMISPKEPFIAYDLFLIFTYCWKIEDLREKLARYLDKMLGCIEFGLSETEEVFTSEEREVLIHLRQSAAEFSDWMKDKFDGIDPEKVIARYLRALQDPVSQVQISAVNGLNAFLQSKYIGTNFEAGNIVYPIMKAVDDVGKERIKGNLSGLVSQIKQILIKCGRELEDEAQRFLQKYSATNQGKHSVARAFSTSVADHIEQRSVAALMMTQAQPKDSIVAKSFCEMVERTFATLT